MKLAAAAAAALALATLAAPSLACRVGPAPRPVTPVAAPDPGRTGGEVQRLLRAADDADAAASREEITARTTIRRAEALHRRADAAIERATFLRGAERARALAEASSLDAAATRAEDDADRAFERAGELRARARDLRARAGVGSGGGWRRRASPQPFGGATI